MADAKAEGGAAPKKKLLMFVVIGVVAVLLLGGGVLAYLMLRSDPATEESAAEAKPAATSATKKEKKKVETGHGKGPIFEKLPQFTVNLVSENGEVLQTDIAVELPNAVVQEEAKALMPKIQSNVNKLLSSKKPEELKTPAGRDKLEGEIKELVNKILEVEGEEGVTSVNFTTFIIR